jgi:hypothetical protein
VVVVEEEDDAALISDRCGANRHIRPGKLPHDIGIIEHLLECLQVTITSSRSVSM